MKIKSKIIANPDNDLINSLAHRFLPVRNPSSILTINIQRHKGVEQIDIWYDDEAE